MKLDKRLNSFLCIGFVCCMYPFKPEHVHEVLNEDHPFNLKDIDALLEQPFHPEDLDALLNEGHPFKPLDPFNPEEWDAFSNVEYQFQFKDPLNSNGSDVLLKEDSESESRRFMQSGVPNNVLKSKWSQEHSVPYIPSVPSTPSSQGSSQVLSLAKKYRENGDESNQSEELVFVESVNPLSKVANEHVEAYLKQVQTHLTTHVKNCAAPRGPLMRVVQQFVRFKDFDSGTEINDVNALVLQLANNQLGVRVCFPKSHKLVEVPRFRPPVRAVFLAFYQLIPLLELNHATNWLWRVLTQHEESLPVIGFIKAGTAQADYKFGPIQLALIDCISSDNYREGKALEVAQMAAQKYLGSRPLSTSMTPSSSAGQAMFAQLEPATQEENSMLSSQSSDICFVRCIDFEKVHGGRQCDFLRQVQKHLKIQLERCRLASGRLIQQVDTRNVFKNLESGLQINDLHVRVVRKEDTQLVVRVKDSKKPNILSLHLLQGSVRSLFLALYHLAPPEELNGAANWLWRALTQHEKSLPVIGLIKPGTDTEDYKFGSIQLLLIESLSTRDQHDKQREIALIAIEENRRRSQSLTPATSSSPNQAVLTELEDTRERRKRRKHNHVLSNEVTQHPVSQGQAVK